MIFNVLIGYAVIVLIGGTFGYLKAGSLVSLVASVASSAALITSAFFMRNHVQAERVAIFILLALLLFFGIRWWWGGAFMPSGLMTLLTLVPLSVLFYHLIQSQN